MESLTIDENLTEIEKYVYILNKGVVVQKRAVIFF